MAIRLIDYFPSFCVQSYAQSANKMMKKMMILLTRFCKLLTTVAILSGGHVPQWHDASGTDVWQQT